MRPALSWPVTACDIRIDGTPEGTVLTASSAWPSWHLDQGQLAALDLLVSGAAHPISRYLTRLEYETVDRDRRLPSGEFAPWPFALEVSAAFADSAAPGSTVALRDPEGVLLAALTIDDVWTHSTPSTGAPAAHHPIRLGGRLQSFARPRWPHLAGLDPTPQAIRDEMADRGWNALIVADPEEVPTRAQRAFLTHLADPRRAGILLQAAVATSIPAAVMHARRQVLRSLWADYPRATTCVSMLPVPVLDRSERGLLLRAVVAGNCAAATFVVPASLAGVWARIAPAQRAEWEAALGLEIVEPRSFVYVSGRAVYSAEQDVPAGVPVLRASETDLRRTLASGGTLPEELVSPAVARALARRYPPLADQGFTVFFTGLSGSGKSTMAQALHGWLLDHEERHVTVLDGDVVRRHLSSELGFSPEDRALNVRRIGFVAAEVTRHGGIALCAPIAPSDSVRRDVRAAVEAVGGFVLVHVDTPLEVCERRDRKGLYAKARAGLVPVFTGVSDRYESPTDAELVIDASTTAVDAAVARIVEYLHERGYLQVHRPASATGPDGRHWSSEERRNAR